MADIDFLSAEIQQSTNARKFGICDSPLAPHEPAYITSGDGDTWIATVINGQQTLVSFYPIDNGIDFIQLIGSDPSKCEGVLELSNNDLILVELKERVGEGWYSIGKKQIISTIELMENHNPAQRARVRYAYICNSRRPKSNVSRSSSMQEFAIEYSIILKDKTLIDVS